MNLFTIVLIGVSLSMDSFSYALAYGTLNLKKSIILKLSIIVGIYHFFMPIFGMLLKYVLVLSFNLSFNFVTFIIFTYIGLDMIFSSIKEKKKTEEVNMKTMLLFGLAVSIDSFSTGIGIKSNYVLCPVVFSVTSFIFTYIGLIIGKKASNILGSLSTILGGALIIIIGILSIKM